ncbi:hypothetical protein D918_10039 [Trichuris suis]|nr:hypothetical protein D918_10039 [Trichuris suis]
MADIYLKFNEMNLLLQGDDLSLIRTKAVICAFIRKLIMYKQNLGRGEFHQFPNPLKLKEKSKVHGSDVEAYCEHLGMLHQDFASRFEDIIGMEIPTWVIDPFRTAGNLEPSAEEELIELQTNEKLRATFKSDYQAFWMQRKVGGLYPRLSDIARKLLIAFPSSYLVERGFSVVSDLVRKKRNRLQIAKRGDLRVRVTNMKSDIGKLISLRQNQAPRLL